MMRPMTIAACYLSSEGVVLGADSTSTIFVADPSGIGGQQHHLNYAQKVFEVGEDSSVGAAIWGPASIGDLSHRTFVAQCADELAHSWTYDVQEIAERISARFWKEYQARCQPVLDRYAELEQKANRSPKEECD